MSDSELFLGYVPAFDRMTGWRQVFRHQHATPEGAVVRRGIWSQATDTNCRLLVDVAECRTPNAAVSRLAEIKDDSNVLLVEGPVRLGRGALVNAERERGSGAPRPVKPRSVYFLRANLLIWLLSSGERYCDVLDFADRIVSDLDARAPEDAEADLVLARQPASPEASDAICLSTEPKWARGESAWYRFTAEGGTLSRAAKNHWVLVRPESARQDVKVSAWAMEPGRKPYRGRYVRPAEQI